MGKNSKAFEKQIADWVEQTNRETERVVRDGTKQLIDDLQAAMPYESGNLRRSVTASRTPIITPAAPDHVFTDQTAENNAVIDSTNIGDPLYVSIPAAYAVKEEYGSGGRAGKFFFTRTASKWRGIIRSVAKAGKRKR